MRGKGAARILLRLVLLFFPALSAVVLLLPRPVVANLAHLLFSAGFLGLFLVVLLSTLSAPSPRGLLVEIERVGGSGTERFFYPGVTSLALFPNRRPPEVSDRLDSLPYGLGYVAVESDETRRRMTVRVRVGVVVRVAREAGYRDEVVLDAADMRAAGMDNISSLRLRILTT